MGKYYLYFLVGRNHQLVKAILVWFSVFIGGTNIYFAYRLAIFIENNPFYSGILSQSKLATKKEKQQVLVGIQGLGFGFLTSKKCGFKDSRISYIIGYDEF